MRARFRAALRRGWLDLGPALGSWRLSIVLLVLAALYFFLLAVVAAVSAAEIVRRIAQLAPFWIVYSLLLLNTGVCFARRLPLLRRDLARRGRRQLGSFLFHGSFFLIALGFLLTLLGRQEARVWVAVGEEFEGRSEQYLAQSPPRLLGGALPDLRFQLAGLTPRFWRDQLLFTAYAAELRFADESLAETRINRPLWLGPATFLRLSGYGFAPRYELTDGRGLRIDTAAVKLNLFPPGLRDHFVIPRFPHRIYVEIYPDATLEADELVNRSQNLEHPMVRLEVRRGRLLVAGGTLGPGQSLGYEGLTLGFPEIIPWAELTLVRDPGAPVLLVAFLLGLAGLTLKLSAPRTALPAEPMSGFRSDSA